MLVHRATTAKRSRSVGSSVATTRRPPLSDKKDKSEADHLKELCLAAEVKVEAENVLQMVESEKGMAGAMPKQLDSCLSKLQKRLDPTRLKHYQPYEETGDDDHSSQQLVTMHLELMELKNKLENYLPVVRAVQAKKDPSGPSRYSLLFSLELVSPLPPTTNWTPTSGERRICTTPTRTSTPRARSACRPRCFRWSCDRQIEEIVETMMTAETDDGFHDALGAFTACMSDDGDEALPRDTAGERMFGIRTVQAGDARWALQEKHIKDCQSASPSTTQPKLK